MTKAVVILSGSDDRMDAGGREPKVGASGDAGEVAKESYTPVQEFNLVIRMLQNAFATTEQTYAELLSLYILFLYQLI